MSFETDISAVMRMIDEQVNTVLFEGFARAKEIYVDQGVNVKRPDGSNEKVKMPLQVLKRLASKDPTYPQKGKYIEWMCRIYLQQRSGRGFESLRTFEELCRRNKIQDPDINHYKSLEDVDDAINASSAHEERKKKSKEETFWDTVKIDTEVLGLIDTKPNWVNPHFQLKVGNYEVNVVKSKDEEADKAKGIKSVQFIDGPQAGKTVKVKETDITGNHGDLYWENDKIMIVCPSTQANSELYGRNPDPTCRGDKHSYWCTSTPGMRYFQQYWGSYGNVLYYILPKTTHAVLYDPEQGHSDRFTKVAMRIESSGNIAEKRDRFNIMIEDDKWRQLCKLWDISPNLSSEE